MNTPNQEVAPMPSDASIDVVVRLNAEAVPMLLVTLHRAEHPAALALPIEQAERFLFAFVDALARGRAFLMVRSYTLPPDHAEVQALLDAARMAVAAHETLADALDDGAGGSTDALAEAREDAFDALSERFDAFDGEAGDEEAAQ